MFAQTCINTVKPVLSGHSERKPKIAFQDLLTLNAGQIIAECSKGWGVGVGGEYSAILPTFINLPFTIKIFVLAAKDRFYCIISLNNPGDCQKALSTHTVYL